MGWALLSIFMSHITHLNVSWHTYEWVMAHRSMSNVARLNESCHTFSELYWTYEWVLLYISMSHIPLIDSTHKCVMSYSTHMNEFYYEYTLMNEFYYEYIMSIPQYSTALLNIWMSSIIHIDWALLNIWMSSIIHINESYEHMNEFYYTYQWVIWVEYDDSTHKCVMAHVSMSNLARLNGNTCDEFCWTYVEQMIASWHTYEWVTSWHTYEWVTSCRTYEWVTSCRIYEWVMSLMW